MKLRLQIDTDRQDDFGYTLTTERSLDIATYGRYADKWQFGIDRGSYRGFDGSYREQYDRIDIRVPFLTIRYTVGYDSPYGGDGE